MTQQTTVTELDLTVGSYRTHIYRSGAGNREAVLFIHGSGPGANGWANWQYALPALGDTFDCIAFDLVGFGRSAHPDPAPHGAAAWLPLWIEQSLGLLDALNIAHAHLVGNSLGGALALHLLTQAPQRFDRAILMGPIGVPFPITEGLDGVWGFYDDPTLERLTQIFRWFVFDPQHVGGDLEAIARQRYGAATSPEAARSFAAMFPPPRQQHVDALVVPEDAIARIGQSVLLVHGRDDVIVPLDTSLTLLRQLPRVQLHVFGQCSHWVQIEQRDAFNALVRWFLTVER
jgi:2-hydroxymuconate-semialdehyde hydrolase